MNAARAREPIAVIGTGYVGLVTAVGFAELGSEVWCVDVDADKIARLQRGEIPIYEPGLAESVARNRERLHFSTELAPALEHARLLFVAVGTPPTYSGDADLSAVNAVVDEMPASDRHALVMKSTVPVGTGAAIQRVLAAQGKGGFAYVSCPEFLKEGSALEDFRAPDRVVIGDDGNWAGDAVVELYEPLDAPAGAHRRGQRRDGQAGGQRLSGDQDLVHQRDRERVRGDRRRRARGRARDGSRPPDRESFPASPGSDSVAVCLVGDETVLVRHRGRTTLLSFERLWRRLAARARGARTG